MRYFTDMTIRSAFANVTQSFGTTIAGVMKQEHPLPLDPALPTPPSEAVSSSVAHLPDSSDTPVIRWKTKEQLQAAYPNIKYATPQMWRDRPQATAKSNGVLDPALAEKKKGKGGSSEDGLTSFGELPTGECFQEPSAGAIRAHARSILIEIRDTPKMGLPLVWGAASVAQKNFFLREMYKRYPDLSLCLDDWKAMKVASVALTQYYSKDNRPANKAKAEKENPRSTKPVLPVKQEAAPLKSAFIPKAEPEDDPDDIYLRSPASNKRKAPTFVFDGSNKRPRTADTVIDLTLDTSDDEDQVSNQPISSFIDNNDYLSSIPGRRSPIIDTRLSPFWFGAIVIFRFNATSASNSGCRRISHA